MLGIGAISRCSVVHARREDVKVLIGPAVMHYRYKPGIHQWLIILWGLALSISAVFPAVADDCSNGTTADIVECLDKQTKAWDRKLNSSYQELMRVQTAKQRDKLRAAQRFWIQYRDANCAFYRGGEGSISRVEAAQCMLNLTESRARELGE